MGRGRLRRYNLLKKGGTGRHTLLHTMICLKKLALDENGYGTVEMLILVAGTIAIGSQIYSKLIVPFRNLHTTAVSNFKSVSSSGY